MFVARTRWVPWLVAVTLALSAPPDLRAHPPPEADVLLLARVEAALDLDSLSRKIWPGWEISDSPIAIHGTRGAWYLIHHPKPPSGFSRLREQLPFSTTVYVCAGSPDWMNAESTRAGGVPTGCISGVDEQGAVFPASFREAFRVHQAIACPGAVEKRELLAGYPASPEHLALADIECSLLYRAAKAHRDSIERKVLEFLTVRSFRRINLVERYINHERRAELTEGVPLYVAERSIELAAEWLSGDAKRLLGEEIGDCGHPLEELADDHSLSWYRNDRFGRCGAAICLILDRLRPGWKSEAAGRCVAPDVLLFEFADGRRLSAPELLATHGFDALVVRKNELVEASKSDAEKLFERVTRREGVKLTINTHHLSGGSIRYDPENTTCVDEHRAVHERLLHVEYSGGTCVHIVGMPVAVVLGEGEFDFRQLILSAPEDLVVTADGAALSLERGVYNADRELKVVGSGLSIEAARATVVVGEDRISFVLQR